MSSTQRDFVHYKLQNLVINWIDDGMTAGDES